MSMQENASPAASNSPMEVDDGSMTKHASVEEGVSEDYRSPPSEAEGEDEPSATHIPSKDECPMMPVGMNRFKECSCCKWIWWMTDKQIAAVEGHVTAKTKNIPVFDITTLEYHDEMLARDYSRNSKKKFFMDLFFRLRFFDSRKKQSVEKDAMSQSWTAFVRNCDSDLSAVMRRADELEERWCKHAPNGIEVKIHRESHNRQISCCVPPRVFCPMCKGNPPRRITKTSKVFAALSDDLKALIKECETSHSSDADTVSMLASQQGRGSKSTSSKDVPARTRARNRGHPSKGSRVAPKYQKPAGSQANERDTHASVDSAVNEDVHDDQEVAQQSSDAHPPSRSTAAAHATDWKCDCEYHNHQERLEGQERRIRALEDRLLQLEAQLFRFQSASAYPYPSYDTQSYDDHHSKRRRYGDTV